MAVARRIGTRYRLEYPIGNVLFDAGGWISNVRVSPDGGLIAFIDHPARGDDEGFVRVVDTKGKLRLTGPYADSGVAWSPRGDEVWSAAPLVATSLSGRSRVSWASPEHVSLQDIARDGRLLFATESRRREIVGFSAGEARERNLTWLDFSFPWDITRDGKTVLFDEQNMQPRGFYLRRLDGSPAVRLGEGHAYALSPDGRWALTTRDPRNGQFTLLPTGPGEPRALPASNLTLQAATFFPDGRRILISGNEPGHGIRLFVQDLSEGKPRAITPEAVSAFFHAVSPDGKSVAAQGPDGRIAIYPIEPGEPRPVPGLTDEELPTRWTPDGLSLYVFRYSAMPGRVDLVDVATGKHTPWKEFQPPDPAGVLQVSPFIISPDGKSYVYSYRRILHELHLATGIR
jgi:dipeptidyl aminopeptidase/acylaminoacyl peptidase